MPLVSKADRGWTGRQSDASLYGWDTMVYLQGICMDAKSGPTNVSFNFQRLSVNYWTARSKTRILFQFSSSTGNPPPFTPLTRVPVSLTPESQISVLWLCHIWSAKSLFICLRILQLLLQSIPLIFCHRLLLQAVTIGRCLTRRL